jgi:hypothetical protein
MSRSQERYWAQQKEKAATRQAALEAVRKAAAAQEEANQQSQMMAWQHYYAWQAYYAQQGQAAGSGIATMQLPQTDTVGLEVEAPPPPPLPPHSAPPPPPTATAASESIHAPILAPPPPPISYPYLGSMISQPNMMLMPMSIPAPSVPMPLPPGNTDTDNREKDKDGDSDEEEEERNQDQEGIALENRRGRIPLTSSSNYNINVLLYNNILSNEYYRALAEISTFHEVANEIEISVTHTEPWTQGTQRMPSTAFCLLLKLLQIRLTYKQMREIISNKYKFHTRCLGLLYLRYASPPKQLWNWMEPLIQNIYSADDYGDCSERNNDNDDDDYKLGRFAEMLLCDMSYFGTTLPRIPVLIDRSHRLRLLLLHDRKMRTAINMTRAPPNSHTCAARRVKALFQEDEETTPAWCDAILQEPLSKAKSENEVKNESDEDGDTDTDTYRVIFTGYEDDGIFNISISDVEFDPTPSKCPDDLMAIVIAQAREASTAKGKQYASRVHGLKSALAMKVDHFTTNKRGEDGLAEIPSDSKKRDRERDEKERGEFRKAYEKRDRDSYSSHKRRTYDGDDVGGYSRDRDIARDRYKDRVRDRDRDRDRDGNKDYNRRDYYRDV